MSCPLTLTYLKEIGKALEGYDQMRILYGTVMDLVDSFKDRADVVPGSMEFQRLRAFYCVELMYSELIRKALDKDKLLTSYAGASVKLGPIVIKLTQEVPRSWEGLGTLIERVDDLDGELIIQLTEIAFAKKSKFGEREEVMLEERFKKTMKVFELCSEAAKLLRRSLGNDELSIHLVGKALAAAVDVLQLPHQVRVDYGLHLLNISPDNPRSPWQMIPASPE